MDSGSGAASAVEILDRTNATAYLKDCVTLLLENRPPDALEFMDDYFKNVTQGTSSVVRCYRYIRLCGRTREVFWDNLVSAYLSLDERRSATSTAQSLGVTPLEYQRLLGLVCSNFPSEVVESVVTVLSDSGRHTAPVQQGTLSGTLAQSATYTTTIPFEEFSCGINACLLFDEFFSAAERLFKELVATEAGEVSAERLTGGQGKLTCDKVLFYRKLKESVTRAGPRALGIPTHAQLQGFIEACEASGSSASERLTLEAFLVAVFRACSPFVSSKYSTPAQPPGSTTGLPLEQGIVGQKMYNIDHLVYRSHPIYAAVTRQGCPSASERVEANHVYAKHPCSSGSLLPPQKQ